MTIEDATRIAGLVVSVAIIAAFLRTLILEGTVNFYLGPLACAAFGFLTGWEVITKRNGKP